MDACVELFIRITMTVAAFHGSQFFGMGELFYIRIRMTPGASRLLVSGAGKFFQIDIKGNGLTFSLRGQLFIRMTLHAVFVRGRADEGGENQGTYNGEQPGYGFFHSSELRTHHEASPFLELLSS
ncbi:MAG: hypothetical protein AAB112_04210 [Thermodesulfobacteriota bacterium]